MRRFQVRQIVAGLCARGRSANQSWRPRRTNRDDWPHGFVAASNPLSDERQLTLVKRPHFGRHDGFFRYTATPSNRQAWFEIEAANQCG